MVKGEVIVVVVRRRTRTRTRSTFFKPRMILSHMLFLLAKMIIRLSSMSPSSLITLRISTNLSSLSSAAVLYTI